MRLLPDNALDVVQKETGLVFAQVLEHAGVYKRTPGGQGGLPPLPEHSVKEYHLSGIFR